MKSYLLPTILKMNFFLQTEMYEPIVGINYGEFFTHTKIILTEEL